MKPHHLTIEALGPYATETTIHFDDLTADGIFLIHGPTGAGKTFLFDAMAYALFAAVPGAREDTTLRSDFAPDHVIPRVVFEFSVAGVRWKVERSPSDDRRVLSGSAKTVRAPKAMLWRLDNGSWRSIAQKKDEVTRELTDIIGLGAKQFHQVMVLPQGAFEQVLRAGTRERENLLKNLFDTSLFERVVAGLEARSKETIVALDKARAEQQSLADQAAQRWTDLTGWPPTIASAHSTGAALSGATAEQCDELAAALHREHQRQEKLKQQLAEELRAAQTAVLATQAEADKWIRRSRLIEAHTALGSQAAEVDESRARLDRSEAAEALRPDLETAGAARRAADIAIEARSQIAADLQKALADPRSVMADLAPVPDIKSPSLLSGPGAGAPVPGQPTWLDSARSDVAKNKERLERLRETTTESAQVENAAKEAEAACQKLSERLAAGRRNQTKATQQLEDLRRRAIEHGQAAEALPDAESAAAAATAAATASAALAAQQPVLTQHRQDLVQATQTTLSCRERFADLREQHLDGIAATLAAELVAGEACMVCGGEDHPNPNSSDATELITRDQLKRAEAEVTKSQRIEAEQTRRVQQQQTTVEELLAAAGAAASDPAGAAADAAQARKSAKRLAELAAAAPSAAAEHQAGEERLALLTAQIVDDTRELATATERAAHHRNQFDVLRGRITHELPKGSSIEAARAHLDRIATLLDAFAETTRAQERTADACAQSESSLAARLSAAGLASESEAAAGLADEASRRQLRDRIDSFDRQQAQSITELASPDFVDLPEVCADPAPQRLAVAALSERHHTAIEGAALLERGAAEFERVLRDYRATMHDCDVLERSAQEISHLAARCSGRVDPKVSLPRWVLASYLAEICEHANHRLDTMTTGRYSLRVEPTKSKGNSQAGLELLVHDAHTGVERPVNTLSGGETFQASLALALGVADVVQSHSGGVQLDALFIDEGFGTLDGESLELAMTELDRLREGGRVVGLISHVATLRDRIQTGVEVTPGPSGSTVRTGSIIAA